MAANRGDPGQIVHNKLAQYPVGVRVAAGKIPTIKRAVRRIKRGNTPLEPDSLRSIPELPDEYITTGGADNLPFLYITTFRKGKTTQVSLLCLQPSMVSKVCVKVTFGSWMALLVLHQNSFSNFLL